MESQALTGIKSNAPPSNVSDTMARLSGKAGVKATMMLDRSLNTVLQTSGSFSSFRSLDNSRNTASTSAENGAVKEEGVEEFAAMIWNFVNSAGGLVHDLDAEADGLEQDDVKLLRLRTKKHELVIVPDAKYIFIVVHDTPPA
ncbi:Dynein light chain roadblock-type 2 [Lachnellula hyalina]|uniref:Dynein light chain roadblock-type 2 n=1 Tax=Lachnellula hyalina TaxID=1316788 RepID=A0A8H8RAJ9_9HELO|nr:Dynein light chain roadblock-type 2 [Lachnellula hyalina]TVY31009.1 Dynein light chain roadblock-type 2 [Lachnellula hyalina]